MVKLYIPRHVAGGGSLRGICGNPGVMPGELHMARSYVGEMIGFAFSLREEVVMNHIVKIRDWMFPVMLILFILQVILLPVVIGLTYATRSERPEHILTYTTGSLVWDKDTSVRPDGSAELSFFETLYENVNAENAEKVLAPGTEKDSIIRLKNNTKKTVRYTAILYSLSTTPDLDIGATLSGDGFSDTSDYTLPDKIKKESVVRAVGGALGAEKMQDFDINWFWNFEDESDIDGRDRIDTYLGNKAADGDADEATLGFYLVVHDGGDIEPSPQTGDNTMIGGYIVLMFISGGMCLILTFARKRGSRDEN